MAIQDKHADSSIIWVRRLLSLFFILVACIGGCVHNGRELHRLQNYVVMATSLITNTAEKQAENETPAPSTLKSSNARWPQVDDRTARAIRNGHRFGEHANLTSNGDDTHYVWNGTRYEKPVKKLATVVTAYYDMPSKHSSQQYEAWFKFLLGATDPMIIFLEPDETTWKPRIEWFTKRRQHAPTRIVPYRFKEDFVMSRAFTDRFWEDVLKRDTAKRYRKGVDVFKIWNEKMVMMQESAIVNPFDTDHFFWIDTGYFRRPRGSPGAEKRPIVRNNITAMGASPTQLLVQNVFTDPAQYKIAGGAWGGTRAAIQKAYVRFFQTFWFMGVNEFSCIGYEQHVFLEMCRTFASLCSVHYSGIEKDWFAMGKRMLPDSAWNWNNSFFELNRTGGIHVEQLPLPTTVVNASAKATAAQMSAARTERS